MTASASVSLPVELIAELRARLGGDVRTDLATRVLYSTDASIYQIEPLGVVIPRTLDDLCAAVELAAKYRVPVLPRGSGSSLAGQAVGAALILDCSRWLDQIVALDPEAHTATVQPGVILAALNQAAAKHRLQFGPDPASAERATMGGVIANNGTGAHSIRYGMAADHILSADVVFADGSAGTLGKILDLPPYGSGYLPRTAPLAASALDIRSRYADAIRARWPSTWRNSAGYRLNYLLPWSPSAPSQWDGVYPPTRAGEINLSQLLAGSEGTLAVMRTITVGLVPKPKHTVLGLLTYDSLAAACDDVPRLLSLHPASVELIPRLLIQLARTVPAYAAMLDQFSGGSAAWLAVEFAGDDPASLLLQARTLGAEARMLESQRDQARVWSVRKVGLGLLDARPAARRPVAFIEDCAIPVEKLGEFVREVERILVEFKTDAGFYAHASAGTLHIRPMLDLRSADGVRDLRAIASAVLALTLRLGGAMSSEHGDGLARSEWLRATYGDEITAAFRQLKQAADPFNILNPGKIVDALPMDTQLRFGADYRATPWQPQLDFSRSGGLQGAIEQCNGAGVCRKADGVMCPSFQATREEMHSTRGRANLLRALMRGGGEHKTIDPRLVSATAEALDLCLACKGCAAECPSGVDMAKLKYEFQDWYYHSHRRPLRDYLFGYFGQLARIGQPIGFLANAVTQSNWGRKFLAKVFRLAPERRLPVFKVTRRPQNLFASSKSSVSTALRKNQPRNQSRDPRELVLYLPDAFTHFFEPEVEQAALGLLHAAGCRVVLLSVLGAGRTLISKGFIEPARQQALRVLRAVRQADPSGQACIVGAEPSEIYALRDEFKMLLPAEEAEPLSARAWMVEEFLLRPSTVSEIPTIRVANISPQSKPVNQKLLLHAHCYQKAQPPSSDGFPIGTAASADLLRYFGYQVEVLNTGCCGMAGAFGYEAEHYKMSVKVGEMGVIEALGKTDDAKDAEDGAMEIVIAAPGTSCRAQITDLISKKVVHPLACIWHVASELVH